MNKKIKEHQLRGIISSIIKEEAPLRAEALEWGSGRGFRDIGGGRYSKFFRAGDEDIEGVEDVQCVGDVRDIPDLHWREKCHCGNIRSK
jgi:hypothetical protein